MTVRSCFTPTTPWRGIVRAGLLTAIAVAAIPLAAGSARAQAIVVAVNGDPITTLDVEQRMKLLRVFHRAAGRDAAIESMVTDRLELREASRYGVNIKDNEIGEQVNTDAAKLKTTTQALLAELARAGVQQAHLVSFFKAELGFTVLVKGLNKGVEASEVAVRAELAKSGGKASITDYSIRQVVFTVDPSESPASIAEKAKRAEALRARFSNCASGLAEAKALDGVAVREPLTRSSTSMSAPLRALLEKTPVGHLTPPSRSPSGLEMVAVCDRTAAKDDTDLRKTISEQLLRAHYDADAANRLKDMRSRAVIEKR